MSIKYLIKVSTITIIYIIIFIYPGFTQTNSGNIDRPEDFYETLRYFEPQTKAEPELPSEYVYPAYYITPLKDQGGCGSCWAFAAVALVESRILRETGIVYDLSEQQLVSCCGQEFECIGCQGGTSKALKYWYWNNPTISHYPLAESCAPYRAADISCDNYSSCIQLEKFSTYDYYTVVGVDQIKRSILEDGPVWLAFYVPSHAVLCIGWNDDNGGWLCKNSDPAGYRYFSYNVTNYAANCRVLVDLQESNNSRDDSFRLELNKEYKGWCSRLDRDWFSINAGSAVRFKFNFQKEDNSYAAWSIYAATDEDLEYPIKKGTISQAVYLPKSGKYYIWIKADDSSKPNDYRFSITNWETVPDDIYEPNDSMSKARPIAYNKNYIGYTWINEQDWFSFNTNEQGYIVIDFYSDNCYIDLWNNDTILSKLDLNATNSVYLEDIQKYYIKIVGNTNEIAEYEFKISFISKDDAILTEIINSILFN